ncbi:uracil-DNA glycosylase [Sulfurimonas lithotrophica]|uniref:Uracil-DNA glycosylase n=1 Tax=Sulfurimonas lithotrophica TaxID=2590022 RepID=A0A5P8P1V7_9BACT|nr:uracil-DNA glycosylase [Sulfurimonas lithotrophica]QFR49723.1 uracil-DNA glycosylase [Sulfurimonas lithotrophica]
MSKVNPKIPQSWINVLQNEFNKDYFYNLKLFLKDEQSKYTIYPKNSNIFNAYNSTEFSDVKVVILGQDPYHGPNQAHGLSFSVQDGIAYPPSLKNIFTELVDDMGCSYPTSGNLQSWANQGVVLLNAVLSVRASQANSHQGKGWEFFTDATIKAISDKLENVVFILWGRPAQMKEKMIDNSKHLILKAPHPSPLSSYRGFFGSKPFSQSNNYLLAHNKSPIEWCLN